MISKTERIFCRLCGKLVDHADKLCSIMHDDPIIMLLIILILVFVSWMLVRALWHFANPIPQRIVHGRGLGFFFASCILLATTLGFGEVAHAADNEPDPGEGAASYIV